MSFEGILQGSLPQAAAGLLSGHARLPHFLHVSKAFFLRLATPSIPLPGTLMPHVYDKEMLIARPLECLVTIEVVAFGKRPGAYIGLGAGLIRHV